MTEDLNNDIFLAQIDPKIGHLRPILKTHLKAAQNDMHTTTVETFWENDQKPFSGPEWPKNWASETYIQHISKSTCNEHLKCETRENVLRKWPKPRILTYLGGQNDPKIGPLRPAFHAPLKVHVVSTCSYNEQVKQYWCETSGNLLRKWPKTGILHLFGGLD